MNLYAEKNPEGSDAPYTHYNVPGLTSLAHPPTAGAGRGLYWANSDALYYVAGASVYLVAADFTMRLLGTLTTTQGMVSMADNGTSLVLVDGSPNGYEVDLTTNVMVPISEVNNAPPPLSLAVYAFFGADRVDMIDGFMLFNQPRTRNFYSTYNNEIVFDALWFAAKNGYSDNLVSVIVTRREIILLGERTTEIWFDAGTADFPFQIMPGPFVQHGCIAKYSVAQVDGAVFWLAQDQAGTNTIVRMEGYVAKPISNPAIENALANYPRVDDAEGFCFNMNGHTFYQLNFPTANKSWRWDERTPGLWHEAVWTDDNGGENRHRASCAAWAYGKNVCADWETGELYAFDLNNCTDAGRPMQFRRGWPHMMKDGQRVIYPGFVLDVQAATSAVSTIDPPGPFQLEQGTGGVGGEPSIDSGDADAGSFVTVFEIDGFGDLVLDGFGNPIVLSVSVPVGTELPEEALFAGPAPAQSTAPLVYLRWSDDRGRTWSNPVAQSLGSTGAFSVQPQWNRTGMARDRIFEVYGTIPGLLAINGAFLDPPPIILGS